MALDIAQSWIKPRAVFARRFDRGQREDQAIMVLMLGAFLSFVAQMPEIARIAHLQERDLNTDLASTAMGTLMILPLFLYGVAALITLCAQLLRQPIGYFGGRLVLFWSYLAATPAMLFYGLGQGLSPGSEALIIVGVIWIIGILWMLISGLREARIWQIGEHNAAS